MAKTPIEKELKYFLAKRHYQKLLKICRKKITDRESHLNCYLDDPKLRLRKKKFGLRVRIVDGKQAFVTLKSPARAGRIKIKSLKVRKEYEARIPFRAANQVIRGKKHISDLRVLPVKVLRDHFSPGQIERIGPLGTIRTVRTLVIANGGSLELEVDKFKVFGKSHYELEVETMQPTRADALVRHLFRQFNIPYHPITKSKLGRFIDEWKKNRG